MDVEFNVVARLDGTHVGYWRQADLGGLSDAGPDEDYRDQEGKYLLEEPKTCQLLTTLKRRLHVFIFPAIYHLSLAREAGHGLYSLVQTGDFLLAIIRRLGDMFISHVRESGTMDGVTI